MPDLTEEIESQAERAASTSTDGNSTTRRSLSDLIAADKYLKANEAAANPLTAIHRFKIVSPSSVGEP